MARPQPRDAKQRSKRLSWTVLVLFAAALVLGALGFWFNSEEQVLAQANVMPAVIVPTNEPPPILVNPRNTRPPTPANQLPAPDRLHRTTNVLLLGSDRRPGDPVWRTDVMMIVFLDPENGRAAVLSLPRDLYVDIPTRGGDRLNIADFWGEYTHYPGGGPGLMKKVIADNFGIRVDHWARVDFDGFKRIIDTVGGVDVEVPCDLEDDFVDPSSPTGFRRLEVYAGLNHMDGETALMYVRQRHNTGDVSRAQRQQRVVYALREKLLSPGIITKIPLLFQQLQDSVQTDFSAVDIPALVQAGASIKPQNIRGRVIDETMWSFWMTPDGKSVLVFDKEEVKRAVNELFNAPPIEETQVVCF